MLNIKRERYVVINDKNKIFAGLARSFSFYDIDKIGDIPIKTYMSAKKAKASFLSSTKWMGTTPEDFETGEYKVVKVTESICEE